MSDKKIWYLVTIFKVWAAPVLHILIALKLPNIVKYCILADILVDGKKKLSINILMMQTDMTQTSGKITSANMI